MKRAMRIIIPIFLAIAVIACSIWYLLVYDPSFTRDLLLSQARHFERQGNHSMAEWCYDQAYAYANQDEDVAIELAQQYKSSGNYTKAEYTLSNAIADGGTAKLYIALCQTYVEQDKLLDAVRMLENITDPAIKAELDAMRPEAPVPDQDPGFYTQYISVSIRSDSGTLYVSTNGQYPSTATPPYTEPITLPAGETTIYAISVAENGLVSPLSIFGYTVGGVVEEVSFTDPAMEAAIREILGAGQNQKLFTNEVWAITDFTIPEDAQSFADLTYMPYLTSLHITGGDSDNLQYLSALTSLQELTLTDSRPSEEILSIIGSMPQLQRLTLQNCGLSTIEPLSTSTKLTYLNLDTNNIRNIAAISNMSQLQELIMPNNALTDLSALSGLSNLTKLDVSFNSITTLATIMGIRGITYLDAGNNAITALGNIGQLTSLSYLSLAYNQISDVSQLAGCTALTDLDISNNQISDITSLSALTQLTNFNFSYNTVAELPDFSEDTPLVTIDGSNNQLSSLEALGNIDSLNRVFMDYNAGITDVDVLEGCQNLYLVNVFGTGVTEADTLRDMSIIVNFDPTQNMG
ncbi:MAG TPA: leucine-rich repeat domain-containing protein [Candidatus Faecousia intestinigallinarum]|nr:leucine-rich repeat domain-containing protein [Candidatus Faecousia intestinigallinarum]